MITLYTDGSCLGNPGRGGWAVVEEKEDGTLTPIAFGSKKNTTNNIMELSALLFALTHLSDNGISGATVYSDSQYAVTGLLSWLPNWKKNNWRGSDKKPVKNRELWIEMDRVYSAVKNANLAVEIKWVKAHNGTPGNEEADRLARERAERA